MSRPNLQWQTSVGRATTGDDGNSVTYRWQVETRIVVMKESLIFEALCHYQRDKLPTNASSLAKCTTGPSQADRQCSLLCDVLD